MEEKDDIANEALLCRCCKSEVKAEDTFCGECGFPLQGTEEEQGKHIGKYIVGALEKDEGKSAVKKSRNALLVLAGLLVIGGIWASKSGGEEGAFTLVSNIVMAIVFAFLALWSEKRPFAAFLTALILFLSLQLLSLLTDPTSVLQGLIIKVAVIIFLINGIVSAAKLKNTEK